MATTNTNLFGIILLLEKPDLLCNRDIGNPHDTHTVAVKKVIDGNLTVVGHIPRKIP